MGSRPPPLHTPARTLPAASPRPYAMPANARLPEIRPSRPRLLTMAPELDPRIERNRPWRMEPVASSSQSPVAPGRDDRRDRRGSTWRLSGLRRGRPGSPRTPGIASIIEIIGSPSGTSAAIVSRQRHPDRVGNHPMLAPFLRRSTGSRPAFPPRLTPAPRCCRSGHAAGRSGRRRPARPAATPTDQRPIVKAHVMFGCVRLLRVYRP
jgi:hypothetical protein